MHGDRFTGPKITLSADALSESQERALEEEGLDIEKVHEDGLHSAPIEKSLEA